MNKYSCYWGEGYGNNKGNVEVHSVNWFHTDIGKTLFKQFSEIYGESPMIVTLLDT